MSRKRLDGSILIGQTLAGANAFGMAGWVRPAQPYTLCHVSGVQTRREVVAGAVCRSIVTQAAMNRVLRQPILLLRCIKPSLRWQ